MPKHAVLFDLDGTLINTLPDIVGVVNRVRVAFGLKERETPEIAKFIGLGAEHLVQGCFDEVVQDRSTPSILAEFRSVYYREPHHGGHLYPGVMETLQSLRQRNFLMGIATNKPERAARVSLAHYLPNFSFDEIAAPENVTDKKPSERHLLEPLERLGVRPEDALFVGDDRVDLVAATSANVYFLGASWGFGGVKAPIMLGSFKEVLDHASK